VSSPRCPHHVVARYRRRAVVAPVVAVALLVGVVTSVATGSSAPSASAAVSAHGYPYAAGASIDAMKLTRMQMLSPTVGVGVAPITTYGGGLVRAYLARTDDAGATWTVTGALPKGFYPWTTAFVSPKEGYVINGGETLLTKNAGRTWSVVTTSAGPLAISARGKIVWVEVERCARGAMNGPCSTYLDSFAAGALAPTSVSKLPSDQPVVTQVSPTTGYATASHNTSATAYYTTNSGVSWRAVATPCAHHRPVGVSVTSSSQLFTYCPLQSPQTMGAAVLFSTSDGGTTWHQRYRVQQTAPGAAVGSTGAFMWAFDGASFIESSDGGREWFNVPLVTFGTNSAIVTYGAHEAWHVLTGRGIFRTLDGKDWQLLA